MHEALIPPYWQAYPIAAFALWLLYRLFRPRRFYFVRHGETILNAEHVKQGTDGALSPRGRAQAIRVAEALHSFPVRRIIASTYPRATETASLIAEELHVPVIASELLIERRNPSEVIGRSTHDPEVIGIVEQIELAYHEDEYRYSDEENFLDLQRRAGACLSFLSRYQGGTVAVTHHVFLKMLIATILHRERLHAGDFVKLSFFNYSSNAGITVCDFHPLKRFTASRGWQVISFNEEP